MCYLLKLLVLTFHVIYRYVYICIYVNIYNIYICKLKKICKEYKLFYLHYTPGE